MTGNELYDKENIVVLHHGQESPMENHGGMEIAVDNETGTFYIHELMLVTYGTDSVIKACRDYAALH